LNFFFEARHITKYFSNPAGFKQLLIENISFSISEEDKITSILAPFGGGKSSLLKILSGLDTDYKGELLLKGIKIINNIPLIPEKPSSLPWLDVIGNIKLINSIRGKNERLSEVEMLELIDLAGLTDYESHYPDNKSYGFRFRITLARAMAVSPQIILIDDSFKMMDIETKVEIFQMIKRIVLLKNIKFLLASSNISDVSILSDKIIFIEGYPCYSNGEILVDKNKSTRLKNFDIQDILLKLNTANCVNYSI
jgi:sulfonate transport system ATP-binding protein